MELLNLKKYFFIILILQYSFVTGSEQSYSELVLLAAEYHSMSKYKTAALTYEKAFNLKTGNIGDYYNAACSWALAGEKSNAFRNLNLALKEGLIPLKNIQNDSDLLDLHEDKRWNMLIISLSQRIEQLESSLDQSLVRTLKSWFTPIISVS